MKDYVLATQDSGKFGTGEASSSSKAPLDEFEVDETCLRKRDVSEDGQVQWTEYVGLKRRGDPESLYLEQRDPNKSKSQRKSNGGVSPPPYTKEEWLALAKKKVRSGSLQHSDGAKAYQQNLDGVERDYVSHSTRGDGPHFVAACSVQGALAGTQSLDGWWGHAKKNCVGLNADDEQIAMHVHEQQWRHWFAESDKFEAGGTVIRFALLEEWFDEPMTIRMAAQKMPSRCH